ncbi:MAG: GNAT family N-acetyltransferase [Candidatus Goldbacteria bacterium]|nr:GNAT family N-acetyltransferase [Candidatus Goldiibacteriota bacterium]
MIKIREIQDKDYAFLEEMLYEMVFFEDPALKPAPDVLLKIPEINRYVRYIAPYGGGVIAIDNDKPAGAAWYILFPENDKGYGFVETGIPEISIAVRKDWRNRGIGTLLLKELTAIALKKGYKALSLSTDMKNPSVRLYERFGFKKVKQNITDRVMLLKL